MSSSAVGFLRSAAEGGVGSAAYHCTQSDPASGGAASATTGSSVRQTSATGGQLASTHSCTAASFASTSRPEPAPAVSVAQTSEM